MSEYLVGPLGALPNFNVPEMQDFLDSPGSIIDTSQEDKTVYPNQVKNHAIIPIKRLKNIESLDIDEESDVGYLIEHLATGLHYFVYVDNGEYGDQGKYSVVGVADFKGAKGDPYDLALSVEGNNRWASSKIDAVGTRIGGIPLNSDGSRYNGKWPYLEDGQQMSFLAQYQLEDQRYIHVFSAYNLEDYDYDYSNMGDDNQDPYACAIIEGGGAPHWIQMRALDTDEQILVHPDIAYTLTQSHSGIIAAPMWIQDDYTPGSGEYNFVIQIGDTDILEDEMDFLWGDAGALYLFADMKRDTVQVIMQDS